MSGPPAKARTWSTNGQARDTAFLAISRTVSAEHPPPPPDGLPKHHHQQPPPYALDPTSTNNRSRSSTSSSAAAAAFVVEQQQRQHGGPVAPTSFIQPRVAAMLNVAPWWHPVLFSLRLLSITPAIYLGFPLGIRFLLMVHAGATTGLGAQGRSMADDRLLLTETALAIIWCGCSGYLSYFFTDCFMSRWLVNYDPAATALRLVSLSALNGYLQSSTLSLSGSSQDPFLLLPTWIIITSTLTMVYHITQRKIYIRKETPTSINIFTMASYISLGALLLQQHWARDWFELPFVAKGWGILRAGGDAVVMVANYANITVEA